MTELKKLTEVFTDPAELREAEQILSMVPKEEEGDNLGASLKTIILHTYHNSTRCMGFCKARDFQESMTKYLEDHKIMSKLVEAGYVKFHECTIKIDFYTKSKKA